MSSDTLQASDDRYPIGRFHTPPRIDKAKRAEWIHHICELPASMRAVVAGLIDDQLNTPYRIGGWTARQVVHHVPDSHLNSYVRFRLALTEDSPVIKPYDEGSWAELPDAKEGTVDVSLNLLSALHARWTLLLEAMSEDQYRRTVQHPQLGEVKLDWMLGLYAWHGRHHVAHVQNLRERMDW